MSPEQLDAIQVLLADAMPGPWTTSADAKHAFTVHDREGMWLAYIGEDEGSARFIAASHQAVTDLVDEAERLRAGLTELRTWLAAHLQQDLADSESVSDAVDDIDKLLAGGAA
jgi:hypothetical protein